MKRRDLFKATTLGIGALATSSLVMVHGATEPVEPKDKEVDVLVVGGGAAGITAAIQAARAGIKTMLVEMQGQLGGNTTSGGVAFPGLFHAWGKQVIAGIGWELVADAVNLDTGRFPDFSQQKTGKSHPQFQIPVNKYTYAAVVEEACINAGVDLQYYQTPISGRAVDGGWQIQCVGKGVQNNIRCKQLIDCSGGADTVGMLGFDRLREAETQPGTFIYNIKGCTAANVDPETVNKMWKAALANGELTVADTRGRDFYGFLRSLSTPSGWGIHSRQYVYGADASTCETMTEANIAGRASVLRVLRFVRKLPGCEKASIESMANTTGIRETYRIVGERQITVDDYSSGRVFDDTLCYAFYPIDLHDHSGVRPKSLKIGTVPTVPLSALAPKGSKNLLVAGRCVSSDRLANSGLRVQASCMSMGQAAAAAATVAVQENTTPTEASLDSIRKLLRVHKAIVPEV